MNEPSTPESGVLHVAVIEGGVPDSAAQDWRIPGGGGDRLVEPDVLSKDLVAYLDAQKRDDRPRVQQIVERAAWRGKKEWHVSHPLSASRAGFKRYTSFDTKSSQ